MPSGSNPLSFAPVEIALKATAFAVIVIGILIVFIWARRTYRRKYFARRDARAAAIRAKWDEIVSLKVSPTTWINSRLDREIIESMLLDRIDVAAGEELDHLVRCIRESGLLQRYIYEVRTWRGWKRQRALVRLGRTRAPEAVAALSEALASRDEAVVTAAVRALGHLESPRAMEPVLQLLAEDSLTAPSVPLKHALVNGCLSEPSLLIRYMTQVNPQSRGLLAQALGQIATAEMSDDLAVLAGDANPEVRASAARALARCGREFAIGLLFTLVLDEVWFVRLRAVASLGALGDSGAIDALVKSLQDSNRIVRQRAAMALVQFENEAGIIIKMALETGDKYALHSYISELQRSGRYPQVLDRLRRHAGRGPLLEVIAAAEDARKELQLTGPEMVK